MQGKLRNKVQADTFEALLGTRFVSLESVSKAHLIAGALYLDQGLAPCRLLVAKCFFWRCPEDDILFASWIAPKKLAIQEDVSRDILRLNPTLQKFEEFEEMIGIKFNSIKLLIQVTSRIAACRNNSADICRHLLILPCPIVYICDLLP